ncbi:MAG: type II toxin-antitoxin system HicB family antitoxin [Magnetococcales bacterium]|nr:type II toxin-antitoxin system HicB family antitoxin [Magnetococcales bacterium]MBF0321404.1 type II toxin-antitoxin system HicB family antitoxin [Magnetococcales bacterium]
MDIRYPAILTPEDGGFLAQFVDLEEAFTEGDTLEDVLSNASKVLSMTLNGRMDEGMDIPQPTPKAVGAYLVAPDAKTQAAMLIRQARKGRSMADVARTMGTSWPAAKRLEDPHHCPSLKQLEKAAAIFGKKLVISFE